MLQAVVGDETNEVNSLPSSMWDVMFPLDAQWPTTTQRRAAGSKRPAADDRRLTTDTAAAG